jgi:hypothetical protein
LNGKTMLQQNFSSNAKDQKISISVPALWASGSYFISLVDKDGATIQSEKIMVL